MTQERTKWTAGPWSIWSDETGAFSISVGNVILCSRPPFKHRAEESRANARLIAAAPDMAAALEEVVTDADEICTSAIVISAGTLKLVRAALAKAKANG